MTHATEALIRNVLLKVSNDKNTTFHESGGLTLGELIGYLRSLDHDLTVKIEWNDRLVNIEDLGSYRGYYDDIAIEPGGLAELTAQETANMLHDAIGRVYEGYKGGDFRMDTDTPVWVSHYGDTSGIGVTGVVATERLAVITTGICEKQY
jgi:hypothetical protein